MNRVRFEAETKTDVDLSRMEYDDHQIEKSIFDRLWVSLCILIDYGCPCVF